MNCGPCAVDSTEQNENLRKMEIKIVLHFKDQANEHNQPVPVPVQPPEHTEIQKPCLTPLQTCNMGKGKWQGCLSKSFPQHCYLSIFSAMNSVITFCNECLPFPFSTVLVLHSLQKKKCDLYGIPSLQTTREYMICQPQMKSLPPFFSVYIIPACLLCSIQAWILSQNCTCQFYEELQLSNKKRKTRKGKKKKSKKKSKPQKIPKPV